MCWRASRATSRANCCSSPPGGGLRPGRPARCRSAGGRGSGREAAVGVCEGATTGCGASSRHCSSPLTRRATRHLNADGLRSAAGLLGSARRRRWSASDWAMRSKLVSASRWGCRKSAWCLLGWQRVSPLRGHRRRAADALAQARGCGVVPLVLAGGAVALGHLALQCLGHGARWLPGSALWASVWWSSSVLPGRRCSLGV